MDNLRTGYFANVNKPQKFTKVHFVDIYNKPICGSKISDKMSYQWCSNGITLEYVECQKCKSKYLASKKQ